MSKPYRPCNGSEGDWFNGRFCNRCVHQPEDPEDGGCEILHRAMLYDVEDSQYPKEWITDDDGPRCTAFEQRVKPSDVVQAIAVPKPFKPLPNQQELF